MRQARLNAVQPPLRPYVAFPIKYSTEEVAGLTKVKAESIRSALCRQGQWNGLRPTKLPNGRLVWDGDDVHALLAGR